MERIDSPEKLKALQQAAQKKQEEKESFITMCGGTGCQGSGCQKVIDKLKSEVEKRNLSDTIGIKITGCQGFCEQGPLMVIRPQGSFYIRLEPEDIPEILEETIENKKSVDRLLYTDPESQQKIEKEQDIPFYKHQKRLVFKNNGFIEPTEIDDYFNVDGYSALAKTLYEMSPEDVIEETIEANLRGRGGAGFPAGKKWKYCRQEEAEPKYLACNADEGDPGAYMDRSILEGNPHLVIEGMILAAYAIGAHQGYIYVRAEYPLAVKHTKQAIEVAREYGLLGDNIMGTDFSFDLEVAEGAGAFVAGESTALMHSIEGKRPMPRQTPPRSVQQGLFGKPTVLNNVETFGNVPLIIMNGAEWFKSIGTENSKGAKIFSLVGKVNNTGLIEVPMGITLRKIVFDIGGGIPGGKKVKAVQTGGPSGGCIPEDLFDLKVDFDELSEAGSMMGSGGMVVMDEDTCMVDVAKFFLDFTASESCGKCLPCREGCARLKETLNGIVRAHRDESPEESLLRFQAVTMMEDLAKVIQDTAACGLGQTAPNPILSTLEYFQDEYNAHVFERRCPSGVCTALLEYYIDPELCTGCGLCVRRCPDDAIIGEKRHAHYIATEKCINCGTCRQFCPFGAIKVR